MGRKVLVADDHEMMRAGVCSIIQKIPNLEIVAEASDGLETVAMARQLSPDLVVMDITMPLLNGVEAARQIREFAPDIKIIVLSIHCDHSVIREALRVGVNGYLLKSGAVEELAVAVRAAFNGQIYLCPKVNQLMVRDYLNGNGADGESPYDFLTAKQREVLQLLAEGMSNKAIATCLCISTKTVEAHRAHLMEKLSIHTVAGLTKYAIREGLTAVED